MPNVTGPTRSARARRFEKEDRVCKAREVRRGMNTRSGIGVGQMGIQKRRER
jgi:hypothetical protein